MLDPLPIGQKEEHDTLKCELCGQYFSELSPDECLDFENIDETGACIYCDKNRDNEIISTSTEDNR